MLPAPVASYSKHMIRRKVYHSNKCRTNYIKKRCEAKIVQRRKLKQKKLEEKTNADEIMGVA